MPPCRCCGKLLSRLTRSETLRLSEANLKEASPFEDRVTKLVAAGEASQADLAKATFGRSVLEQASASHS